MTYISQDRGGVENSKAIEMITLLESMLAYDTKQCVIQ